MYTRKVEEIVDKYLKDGQDRKILFIWGPRRSGKTTLITKLSQSLKVPVFNLDLDTDRQKFVPEMEKLEKIAKISPIILIDEVQNYPESTVSLKILHDHFKVKIIATGSSELRQKAGQEFDSLAGRFTETFCLPLSIEEINTNFVTPEHERNNFLTQLPKSIEVFGSYPEVYNFESDDEKITALENIVETYILKDVVNIYDLKGTKLARDILTKIALQLGSEVSIRELADRLGSNASTISSYIEIFIKNYILIPLPSFKTNLRNAVSQHRKLYFYDLGIRNALIKDFRELDLRPDGGGLWENFIISEMQKYRLNHNLKISSYFYREYGGKEVDLVVEDYYKKYFCFEIKLSKDNQKIKPIFPIAHSLDLIKSDNYFKLVNFPLV